jgi:hypothetical protein
MKTKTIDTIYLDKNVVLKEWLRFLDGGNETFIETTFNKFAKLLEKRWIVLEDDFVYDHNIKACWYGLRKEEYDYLYLSNALKISDVLKRLKDKYKNIKHTLDIPTQTEIDKSIVKLNPDEVPFETWRYSSDYYYSLKYEYYRAIYKNGDKTQNYGLGSYYTLVNTNEEADLIPLLRLTTDNNFNITNRETFFRFIVMGLVPTTLKDDKIYNSLMNDYKYSVEEFFNVQNVEVLQNSITISPKYMIDTLIKEDTVRADLTPYNQKMLEDIEQGHWSLWDMENQKRDDSITVTLDKNLVARDPAMDINDGVVGIDFGTKSTVVVYQKDNVNIHPMSCLLYTSPSPRDS